MLFHLSIDADHPQHVAEVLAEFWGGVAMPFPPVVDGSWVAFAGDDRGTIIEVYPRGTELHASAGSADAYGVIAAGSARSATHFAMATNLSEADALAIARREGWPAKICSRGGKFGVIEIFVEGTRMIEVLTPAMQAQYLDAVTIPNWRAMLGAGAPQPALAA